MAEYASNGKGNLGVTLGAIGTGLGALTNGLGGLFGNNPANNSGENTPVNRYENNLQARIAELETEVKLRDANVYSDQKLNEAVRYLEGKIGGLQESIYQQAVVNAQVAANLSCMQNTIATLSGMTKTVIPLSNICPEPMQRYNSWTAPTDTTASAS